MICGVQLDVTLVSNDPEGVTNRRVLSNTQADGASASVVCGSLTGETCGLGSSSAGHRGESNRSRRESVRSFFLCQVNSHVARGRSHMHREITVCMFITVESMSPRTHEICVLTKRLVNLIFVTALGESPNTPSACQTHGYLSAHKNPHGCTKQTQAHTQPHVSHTILDLSQILPNSWDPSRFRGPLHGPAQDPPLDSPSPRCPRPLPNPSGSPKTSTRTCSGTP